MRAIVQWLACLMVMATAVAVGYLWVDRPIALMVHEHFHLRRPSYGVFEKLAHIPDPLVPLAVLAFVVLGLRTLLGRSLSGYQAAGFVCSVSVICAEAIKDQLKFIFGRTWPETWVQNNPSFIRDGAYGFHFMHGGTAYQSFPSGHMGATCALMTVLWIWYPRFRWFYAIGGVVVGAGLVAANYHFLSDVLAGAFVGLSTGWMAMAGLKAFAPMIARRAK